MSGFTPFPLFVIHQTTRLNHTDALTQLNAFLTRAENDAAYRPDSTLSERGPISSSTTANTDLTLHHLNRIKLGLQGKNLGVEDLESSLRSRPKKRKRWEEGDDGSRPTTPWQGETQAKAVREVATDQNGIPIVVATQESENEWLDKDDYEQAQDDEDVDLHNGQRDPGAALLQPSGLEEEQEMLEIEIEETGEHVNPNSSPTKKGGKSAKQSLMKSTPEDGSESISKEERKRRKKERTTEEKRRKEAEKLRKS